MQADAKIGIFKNRSYPALKPLSLEMDEKVQITASSQIRILLMDNTIGSWELFCTQAQNVLAFRLHMLTSYISLYLVIYSYLWLILATLILVKL